MIYHLLKNILYCLLSIPLQLVCEEYSPVRHEHVALAFEAWPSEGFIIPSESPPPPTVQMGEVMESEGSIRHAFRLLPQAAASLG